MESTETTVTDRIERSINIDAPAERVWELISRPGWWINEGAIVEQEVEDRGDHVVVRNPPDGEFTVYVVSLDPPCTAAFRWYSGEREDGTQPPTLVELTVEPRQGHGVTLTVVESGFAALSPERRDSALPENTAGWEEELAAARTFVLRGR